ncbi:MAG TPA: TIGR03435 family protein [Vicinamibacterales bacterium]|nr:TIGR03435 family protein [Vicinamibacterales bacterium]
MRYLAVLAATVLIVPLQAQSSTTFDVVSIKPNKSGAAASETETTPGRLNLINVTPLSLLLRAFGVLTPQIVGAPGWLATERYDVVASVPGGAVLTDQTRQAYMERMLTDRWRLRYHRETRDIPVYSLVTANEGSKMVTHTGPGEYGMKVERAGPRVILRSTRGNMPRLVEILSGFSGRVVSNDTGLGGEYDFTLEWIQDANATDSGPSLFTALREQLGLRLVSAERPAPVIVIDQIERPSEN